MIIKELDAPKLGNSYRLRTVHGSQNITIDCKPGTGIFYLDYNHASTKPCEGGVSGVPFYQQDFRKAEPL
jgi:hypothetical protein